MKKQINTKYPHSRTKNIRKSAPLKKKPELFIVGIGASAGGLSAMKQFFNNASSASGLAYIIVQHLDPTHKSLLSELLARQTKMEVAEVKAGIKVKANCVYIIPPNKDLRIFHGKLQLLAPIESRSQRRPIDSFFQSLADDQKEKAIGIVLSGTGTEGTLGLRAIKAQGGLTVVQDPTTAEFEGMPQNAIAANAADYILPPKQMPQKLQSYVRNRDPQLLAKTAPNTHLIDDQLKKIFQIIRKQTGHDFSNYKTTTIIRRILKRAALNQFQSVDDYVNLLQTNAAEVEKLYKDFLIGVTSFFRDKDVFSALEKKAIPHLLETCIEKQEIRIWVCGCSTGEEAYSLAILIREAIEKKKQYIKVVIFASDMDKVAIEYARNGIYSVSSLSNVTPDRLSHYFVRKDAGFQLKKEIREMVVFAHHNIIKDPPFSRMDLISCRNLLIYMNSELQKKIIPIFHYSLNKEGILLLGTSESTGESADLFSVMDAKMKLYKKKESDLHKTKRELNLPPFRQSPFLPEVNTSPQPEKKVNITNLTEKILMDQYAPPSVIIDKNNTTLYFSGNTGQYLEPPRGQASFNIFEMAKKGIKTELEKQIRKARSLGSETRGSGIRLKVNSHFQLVNVVVRPLSSREAGNGALLVIFENAEKLKKEIVKKSSAKGARDKKIEELEKELKITSQNLQLAVNELETSNEDLQAANEEYQSTNEELQSTNEELETSREELQSVNEELITVNTELSSKIDQLSQSNDDLNNLLSSIEVATIFLDRNLNIKRFTPAATKLFNLIPSDIDRPVTHLSGNILYKELGSDVKNVLKTLAVKSAEVKAVDGVWYHMRILPYRTTDNIIEGVLVTFVDISDQKRIEEKLKTSDEHLNLIMENLPAVPFTCLAGPSTRITFVGKSSEKVLGFKPEQLTEKTAFWFNRIHPADKKKIRSAFSNITKKGSYDLTFRWKTANGKYKKFINFIRYVPSEKSHPAYVVGVWQELKGANLTLK